MSVQTVVHVDVPAAARSMRTEAMPEPASAAVAEQRDGAGQRCTGSASVAEDGAVLSIRPETIAEVVASPIASVAMARAS